MNVLITGGLGFIGSKLVSSLIQNPQNKVCIIDNASIKDACLANPDINLWIDNFKTSSISNSNILINKDISDCDLDSLIENYDVIYHLAANPGVQKSIQDPKHDLRQNFETTFRILEAIRVSKNVENKKLIFSSSAAPLAGNDIFPINEDLPIRPLSPYGASKASAEAYILAYQKSFAVNSTILRFSNVYGPGSLAKNSIVSKMIKQALKYHTVSIFGNGLQTRDFVYIDDLVNVLTWCSANKVFLAKPLHLCTELPTRVIDIAKFIKKSLEEKVSTIKNIEIIFEDQLVGDAYQNYSSVDQLVSMKAPKIRLINQELINKTVSWFLENINDFN